jgi:predicted Zn-dependent protease with MMP-like domain
MDKTPPIDWRHAVAPTLAEMEAIAEEAYARLPTTFRALCEGLVIHVDDFPSDEVLRDMACETEFDLLGLFHGVGLPFQSVTDPQRMPNMVWLYRRPIIDYWAEHEETLGHVITHVLVHEIGHHFGLSDEDMEAIEKAADEEDA